VLILFAVVIVGKKRLYRQESCIKVKQKVADASTKKPNKDLGTKRKMSFSEKTPDSEDMLIIVCVILAIIAIVAFIYI
jgi:hypothetical protein